MKNFLRSPVIFPIVLFVAVILRVQFEIVNPKLTSDHSIQIEAAKNFNQGYGLSNTRATADDLSLVEVKPMKLWAMGLPVFLSFSDRIFNDLIYSEIFFQVLGILLFLAGALKLLNLLKVRQEIKILFLLLYGFNCTPFSYLGSTDLFTGGLFLWIALFCLKESSINEISYPRLLTISLCAFLVAAIRFACIPNIVIAPLFFMVVAWIYKTKRNYLRGSVILLLSGIFTLTWYHFFPIDSSRISFVETIRKGEIFWSHLKWTDSFPVKAFLFTRPIEFRLPSLPLVLKTYRIALHIFSIILLVLLFQTFRKTYPRTPQTGRQFAILLLVTFVVVVGFIAQQSLTVPPESDSFGPSWMPPFWTHVYSTRYFIFCIFIFIVFYFLQFEAALETPGKLRCAYYVTYGIFLFWAIIYWLFINYQFYSPRGNGAGTCWYNKKNEIITYYFAKELEQKNGGKPIVIAHHSNKIIDGNITTFAPVTSTDDYDRIVRNDYRHSKPLSLLMVMPAGLSEYEKKFLNDHPSKIQLSMGSELLVQVELNGKN